jgi:hypothetical protein
MNRCKKTQAFASIHYKRRRHVAQKSWRKEQGEKVEVHLGEPEIPKSRTIGMKMMESVFWLERQCFEGISLRRQVEPMRGLRGREISTPREMCKALGQLVTVREGPFLVVK